jgi:hypothetical protein
MEVKKDTISLFIHCLINGRPSPRKPQYIRPKGLSRILASIRTWDGWGMYEPIHDEDYTHEHIIDRGCRLQYAGRLL